MPFLHRDGVALCVERTVGRAPPVLLIHGWCCEHRHMAPQAEHFARQGHAVMSVDLRGHGRSDTRWRSVSEARMNRTVEGGSDLHSIDERMGAKDRWVSPRSIRPCWIVTPCIFRSV